MAEKPPSLMRRLDSMFRVIGYDSTWQAMQLSEARATPIDDEYLSHVVARLYSEGYTNDEVLYCITLLSGVRCCR